MERYSIKDAQDHLQQLIDDAQHGKEILIQDDNAQTVQLVPVAAPEKGQPRKPGSARGLIEMSPDFDEPLDDFKDYM